MEGKLLLILGFAAIIVAVNSASIDSVELTRQKRQHQLLNIPTPAPKFNFNPPPPNPNDQRFKLDHFQASGGGRNGFDVSAAGQAKLWQSPNKMNTIHGTGSYSQHLGGPYGNSQPNFGGGIRFTHRF